MINFFRLIFALFIILIITPQTEKENSVVKKFHESGIFISYSEAKNFVNLITWSLIFLFLVIGLF